MLSTYQLNITGFHNISIGHVKKLVSNFFDKEQCVFIIKAYFIMKSKKIYRILEFNQSQWLKPYVEFNTQKRKEAEKIGNNDVKCRTK